jgi:hypothetical protein
MQNKRRIVAGRLHPIKKNNHNPNTIKFWRLRMTATGVSFAIACIFYKNKPLETYFLRLLGDLRGGVFLLPSPL